MMKIWKMGLDLENVIPIYGYDAFNANKIMMKSFINSSIFLFEQLSPKYNLHFKKNEDKFKK